MLKKYAYRVRILLFAKRKKRMLCRYTHAEIRMIGKRQYKTNQQE